MTDVEILQLLVKAKELGVSESDVEAFKAKIAKPEVPEMSAEEIIKSMNPLDEITDEEILYYATPYWHELQAQKKLKQDAIKEEVRNG